MVKENHQIELEILILQYTMLIYFLSIAMKDPVEYTLRAKSCATPCFLVLKFQKVQNKLFFWQLLKNFLTFAFYNK